jgi:DNA helicase-2/ATP-dependent DNA helicase PcrA
LKTGLSNPFIGDASLTGFLMDADLQSDADNLDGQPNVLLMTLHTAKGLEFDTVFMIGMVEGVLPHWNAMQSGTIIAGA